MVHSLGSDPSLDEPEPRLAIFGPPAITRRMFRLWRTKQSLMARFDLRNPLHRRDYALWLSCEGRSLGLDQHSLAAAVALVRQGTSLSRVPPPWPAQSERSMTRRDGRVDAWLAEPIAWSLGEGPGGIPMPRALALLWELRRDVHLHFPMRTCAEVLTYLGWCLTQGIRDQCVAVELIEPVLAGFLDMPDLQYGERRSADEPPLTRLLQLMAPLYDGPYRDFAREFPHTRRGWSSVAIWVCGALRRRFGWPKSFLERPLRWLTDIAWTAADAFVPLTNLAIALWEMRPDLQDSYDLGSHESRAALLDWYLAEGMKDCELDDLCTIAKTVIPGRPQRAGPGTHEHRHSIKSPLARVHRFRARGQSPRPGMTQRDLCLVGYAGMASGRAEDLRMTALALHRQGQDWAMLDRLSGVITTENGRNAAGFAEPPTINLLHLNADTAFFDYGFLRERGLERGYTIGYWAWELAKFPQEWASSFAFVDEVWVGSRFTYDAIAQATTKPVLLMPMAVALPPAEPGLKRADFGLPEDKFIFYFSFDFRSYTTRKNPLAAIEAFRRAFPDRDAPAVLLLKTIGSDWKPDDRDNLLDAISRDPRILLLDHELTRARAIAFLALTDCFLSLHRSEGFGRGPAEAMLLGKPVITTDYSGTTDFATRETALLVDYQLVPVEEKEYPGASGQVWAEPDIEQAAAAMRRISQDPALARRLGRAGRELVRRRYDPEAVGVRYVERIREIKDSVTG